MFQDDPHLHAEIGETELPEKGFDFEKAAFLILSAAIVAGLYATSRSNVPLFHGLVGAYGAAVAFAIFMVAWNCREYGSNTFLTVVGVAYLAVGFLDILHTFSLQGMRIFTDSQEYAYPLWIASRFLESGSLVAGLLTLRPGKHPQPYLLLALYVMITAAVVLSIFILGGFPACFVEGQGETLFKRVGEGIVIILFGMCLILLRGRKSSFSEGVYRLFQWAMLAAVVSETALYFDKSVHGVSCFIGYYLKLVSMYFLYRAIVQTGMLSPYGHVFRELKAKERELQKLALMDELTGLYNRRAAFMFLRKTLSRSERAEKPCTICYVDVDALKTINDRFGHKEGDRVIRAMGRAILAGIREMDYGCRIGGDEFLMVFPECREAQVLPIIDRIREQLQTLLKDRLWEFPVDFSYGLSEYKGYGVPDVDRIVETADNRMYENKDTVKKKVRT